MKKLNIVYSSIIDLLTSRELNAAPLGNFNGIEYYAKNLMTDLIADQYINHGGVQKSTEFIRYIDPLYLDTIGMFDNLDDIILNFVPILTNIFHKSYRKSPN